MTHEVVDGSRGRHVPFKLIFEPRPDREDNTAIGLAVEWANWAGARRQDELSVLEGYTYEAFSCQLDTNGTTRVPVKLTVFEGNVAPLWASSVLHREEEHRQVVEQMALWLMHKLRAARATIFVGPLTWTIENTMT